MDILEFTWTLDIGRDTVDDSSNSPLSRAFAILLGEGRPYKAHSLCYVQEPTIDQRTPALRWLGVFVYSEGDRVIFFPGYTDSVDWLETTSQHEDRAWRQFDLDHLSLEPQRQQWHFTSPGSANHAAGGRSPQLGEGRQLWFGLSMTSLHSLREVVQKTVIRYPTPPSDASRRIEAMTRLDNQSEHKAIRLPEHDLREFQPGFAHFTLVYGPKNAPNYEGSEWLLPFGSPYIAHHPPDFNPKFNVRLHRLGLTNTHDIQIASMWLPGELDSRGVYTSKARV